MSVLQNINQFLHSTIPQYRLSSRCSFSEKSEIDVIYEKSIIKIARKWKYLEHLFLPEQSLLSSVPESSTHKSTMCIKNKNIASTKPSKDLERLHCCNEYIKPHFERDFESELLGKGNFPVLEWKSKYVSKTSFEDNKRESNKNLKEKILCCIYDWPKKNVWFLQKNVMLIVRSGHQAQFIQIRGFKSVRNQAEYTCNNHLITRIKRVLGLTPNPPKLTNFKSDTINKLKDDSVFKNVSSETLSSEEKERIKIAFAEGFLAGSQHLNPKKSVKWLKIVQQLLTIILFMGIFVTLMAGTSNSVFKMPLGSQVEVDPEEIHVTFNDVKGVDEAKRELEDVVEFLKNPEKFGTLGAKLPKGVLLVGPPGTGKTLLARAVAGEANVPFFHAAGPEFDEILVGQGARRVRDLFKAAKERSPCVVFIDEIDSIGSKRTNSVLHPYANQTINQLLTEMDGFHHNAGVIVLGATNRKSDLDTALLRPGRFDVVVHVPKPDFDGRKDILNLYVSKILSKDIDIDLLARGTLGFTGADLENMVNQAALHAALEGADFVTTKYMEDARDKILMGPERKSRLPDDEANLITAYHEGGHAIVAYYTKDSDALHKVTIIPRGSSLGHTAYIPDKENYHVTKSKLLATIDTLMGGRAAEEIIFGPDKITSGAFSDLKGATSIATHMVKDWGMSEKVGLRTHNVDETSYIMINELGQFTNDVIDSEIKQILQDSYERAKTILRTHSREHKLLAEALVKYETLDADDVKAIMSNGRLHKKKNLQ